MTRRIPVELVGLGLPQGDESAAATDADSDHDSARSRIQVELQLPAAHFKKRVLAALLLAVGAAALGAGLHRATISRRYLRVKASRRERP